MLKELLNGAGKFFKRFFLSRILIIVIICVFMFCILVRQLFNLQIVQGEAYLDEYAELTENTTYITATRGNIYDRNGKPLAVNELSYSVVYTDTGIYNNGYKKNDMLIKLIAILDEHGEKIYSYLPLGTDENGNIIFTTASESARLRFLRDVFGLTSVNDLYANDKKTGLYMADATAEDIFTILKTRYGVGVKSNGKTTYEIDDVTAVKLINLRYGISQVAYQSYEGTVIATDISEETMVDVLENTQTIQDVSIREDSVRVYSDPYVFSHILGYTGVASAADLEDLLPYDNTYQRNDLVGKAGVEASMELTLSGTKGYESMYLDSTGKIIEISEHVDPVAGDDVYLSIDRDLQYGIYCLLEQHLAGILCDRIKIGALVDTEDSNAIEIEFTTALNQLISNNILSYRDFADEDASDYEKQLAETFTARLNRAITLVDAELTTPAPTSFTALSDELKDYEECIYVLLEDLNILKRSSIDTASDVYLGWYQETSSLQEFLKGALRLGWIDISLLPIEGSYADTSEAYDALVSLILAEIPVEDSFCKLIYKHLITDQVISAYDLCLALYDQGVLPENTERYTALENRTISAYEFFIEQIRELHLTPAMLALDPCSASCVVSDVNTGEVLALVTYPGYDINRFSGSIDSEYYAELVDDQSYPFLNRATQVETAPGSIFKVLSSVIGLDTGIITRDELINDTGYYTTLGVNLHCWNWAGHGYLNVASAITWSCNYFFCEIGYRISTTEGTYNSELGLQTIRDYATRFGLGEKSGVEITESEPYISTTNPIPSCIGQGSHNYANIHLSRYLTTIASSGTLYNYTLIREIHDSEGNVLKSYEPNIEAQVELNDDSIWDTIHVGMRGVITANTGSLFSNLSVNVAGKTGTAEETVGRANHATFIGYAPYENPDKGVTVVIPNGYGSANASSLAADVFGFLYGDITLEDIMTNNASNATNVVIHD